MHKISFRSAILYLAAFIVVIAVAMLAVLGPERFARYYDRMMLNRINTEAAESANEAFRYSLDVNEKLNILSRCLNSQVLAESESSAATHMENENLGYDSLNGTYAFVENKQGPSDKEITEADIYDRCNEKLAHMWEIGILPGKVKELSKDSYDAVLYSAIDVLDPRNSVSVWKVSLSTGKQNADKSGRLLDAYVDAQTGQFYEFYVRTQTQWDALDPDAIVELWRTELGLVEPEEFDSSNPLLETTPYFEKYRFPCTEEAGTVVTIGFYEGINELFLKIAR